MALVYGACVRGSARVQGTTTSTANRTDLREMGAYIYLDMGNMWYAESLTHRCEDFFFLSCNWKEEIEAVALGK